MNGVLIEVITGSRSFCPVGKDATRYEIWSVGFPASVPKVESNCSRSCLRGLKATISLVDCCKNKPIDKTSSMREMKESKGGEKGRKGETQQAVHTYIGTQAQRFSTGADRTLAAGRAALTGRNSGGARFPVLNVF